MLFTATGLLFADTRMHTKGIGANPSFYVNLAYKDWYKTQTEKYRVRTEPFMLKEQGCSWLLDVPELFSQRAPGITCMTSLGNKETHEDYIEAHLNDSKGCGGVMRVAPVGIAFSRIEIERMDREAAQIAAITHGHSLGWLPAAVLAHIIRRIVYFKNDYACIKDIVIEARNTIAKLWPGDEHIDELVSIIDLAIELSENGDDDSTNIKIIGEGWVAEETLAIAVYCSIRYENDFSKAIIAAVNHDGDSDSTGAVTGNIVGAWVGFDAIDSKWKDNLELFDIIEEVAEDLCHGCQIEEYSPYRDEEWETKYLI